MRLTAQVRLFLQGEEVFRKPGFWDKIKSAFGSDVDLRTGELRVTQNALALTEQVTQALALAGIRNAVSLAIDNDVVFQDLEERPDDADQLVAAMRQAAPRFQAGFEQLRAVFEHHAQGMHSLVEVNVRALAQSGQAHAVVAIGGRIDELRPREGEDIEAAKDRIGKALANAQLVPMYKQVLGDLAARIQAGLQRVFPMARLEADAAEVQVVRPSGQEVRDFAAERNERAAQLRAEPMWRRGWSYGPYYDPWTTYYHDPMDTFVNLMVLDALMHPRHHWGYHSGWLGNTWAGYGAPVTIVNYNGAPIGAAADIDQFSGQLSGVHDVVERDFSTATWDDRDLANYDSNSSSWQQYDSGTDSNTGGGYDCASSSDSGSGSSDCSWDCSSDCSWDCSSDCNSDCSWDCSSDCSSDCGGDW
jgi:hypothetical protein